MISGVRFKLENKIVPYLAQPQELEWGEGGWVRFGERTILGSGGTRRDR